MDIGLGLGQGLGIGGRPRRSPFFFRYKAGDDIVRLGGTFSRPSLASYTDKDGVIHPFGAADEQIRDGSLHHVRHPVTGLTVPATLLEGQRTNLCTQSNDLTAVVWSKFQTTNVAVTTGVASDGGSASIVSFAEAENGGEQVLFYTCSGLTVGATYTFSARMRVESGSFQLRLSTTDRNTWDTASVSPTLNISTEEERFSITVTAIAAEQDFLIGGEGKTPFSVQSGDVQIRGVQIEQGPFASSTIPTNGSTVTRAADSLSFPFLHPDTEFSVYAKFIDQGYGYSERVWSLGLDASFDSLALTLYSTGASYGVAFNDTNGDWKDEGGQLSGGYGDLIETVVNYSRSTIEMRGAKNGAADAVIRTLDISGLNPYGPWSENQIILNGGAGGSPGCTAFIQLSAVRGSRTLDWFRQRTSP